MVFLKQSFGKTIFEIVSCAKYRQNPSLLMRWAHTVTALPRTAHFQHNLRLPGIWSPDAVVLHTSKAIRDIMALLMTTIVIQTRNEMLLRISFTKTLARGMQKHL